MKNVLTFVQLHLQKVKLQYLIQVVLRRSSFQILKQPVLVDIHAHDPKQPNRETRLENSQEYDSLDRVLL